LAQTEWKGTIQGTVEALGSGYNFKAVYSGTFSFIVKKDNALSGNGTVQKAYTISGRYPTIQNTLEGHFVVAGNFIPASNEVTLNFKPTPSIGASHKWGEIRFDVFAATEGFDRIQLTMRLARGEAKTVRHLRHLGVEDEIRFTLDRKFDPRKDGFLFSNRDFVNVAGRAPYPSFEEIVDSIRRIPELRAPVVNPWAWIAYIWGRAQSNENGYCYGMAQIALDHFYSGKEASSVTARDALIDVRNAHLRQYAEPALLALFGKVEVETTNEMELEKILAKLKRCNESPVIIGLRGRFENGDPFPHAVVGYKVEESGGFMEISVYDPNLPGLSQTLKVSKATYTIIDYTGLSAFKDDPRGKVSIDVLILREPTHTRTWLELRDRFKQFISFIVHSPVDIAVVNDLGKYVGVKDEKFSQGFPAIYLSDGENKIIVITGNLGVKYNVILSGTGSGSYILESVAAVSGKTSERTIQGSVSKGQVIAYDASIQPTGDVTINLSEPTRLRSPLGGWPLAIAAVAIAAGVSVSLVVVLTQRMRKPTGPRMKWGERAALSRSTRACPICHHVAKYSARDGRWYCSHCHRSTG